MSDGAELLRDEAAAGKVLFVFLAAARTRVARRDCEDEGPEFGGEGDRHGGARLGR